MKPLSRITDTFTESVIREMTRLCDEIGGQNLAQGFPDFDAPEALTQAAIAAIQAGRNQYPVTFGEPELREAIAKKIAWYNGLDYDPATEITVTCGATEAMVATLKALINPGDEVVIFEPFYENYGPDSILSGATPRYVTLHPPDWRIRPEELEGAFNARTKAVVVNTPHNPTGKVFDRQDLEQIAALCHRWNCYAVTDEVYEHIVYEGARHLSLASLPGMRDRTVTINSASKSYSVTGWRVGWAIADASVTQAIRKVHDFLTVGAPTPFQHAVAAGLALPESYYHDLCARYDRARGYLMNTLSSAGFSVTAPAGAYYILADAAQVMAGWQVPDDTAFARALLRRTGVATVPGSSFYSIRERGRSQVRFCFCKRWETLEAVAAALGTASCSSG